MSDLPLEGRVAWITGAGRGIGAATARRLAAAGARVALCARSPGEVEATASALRAGGIAGPNDIFAGLCDVSREQEVVAFHGAARAALGPIDLLVNNAGVLLVKALVEMTDVEWRTVVDVNLGAAWLCSRAVLPDMVARRRGRIVNVSSISGTLGTALLSAYCASKWGLIGLTKALAEEVRGQRVQVMAVAPGSVDTRMLREGRPDLTPDMTPDDVARTILWLAVEAPSAMTGACVEVFG